MFYKQILSMQIPKAPERQSSLAAFLLLGSACVKAVRKHVDEIDPRGWTWSRFKAILEFIVESKKKQNDQDEDDDDDGFIIVFCSIWIRIFIKVYSKSRVKYGFQK